MNFSGELTGLEPNAEYSLWVTEPSDGVDCPDLTTEPTELIAVRTEKVASLKQSTPQIVYKVTGYKVAL